MRVAIHLGAHCTDDESLLKTLLQNKGVLSEKGISVPGPGRYRMTVIKAAQKLRGQEASEDSRDMLIDAIVDDDSAERLVLTHEDFICVPGRIFENGLLYDKAGYKPMWLRNVFAGYPVEFFLAIRNPATFIPAAFRHKRQNVGDFISFLSGVDVEQIRWSDVILAIQESSPDCPLTVWCNEDTPLIWPEVVREVAGTDDFTKLRGGLNIIAPIMNRAGFRRMRSYLSSHPPKNETQRRRILAAFLDKYAIEDAIEEDLDVPGWTQELVAQMTRDYEEDLEEIANLPGVRLISP
ncbi:MAG TPA: hypothetical protein ENJ26_03745 [Rhodobacteraceae bacterium]|nr:hypothetical protein [Paracoccaceae bacterium]